MTEREFDLQVWRRFDTVTLDTGIETTIMYVCFSSRSVRIYVKNSPPEWVGFDRIVSHKSRFGGDPDDLAIIEELHNKVMKQDDEIERLKNEKQVLADKISKNYLADLLRAVNIVKEGIAEKKTKMEKIDRGLELIASSLARMEQADL